MIEIDSFIFMNLDVSYVVVEVILNLFDDIEVGWFYLGYFCIGYFISFIVF